MRTLETITAEMDAVQETIPALAGMTTNPISTLGYLKQMFGTLIQGLESRADLALMDIQAASAASQIGSLAWYVQQALAFQYGQPTTVADGRVTYQAIDNADRIVRQAAVVEDPATGRLILKAVKAGGGGLIPLNFEELSAFRSYMGQVKYAGVPLDVVSLNADELTLTATIRYDPKVLAASGASLLDSSQRPAEAAISTYLRGLPYDSVLTWTGLTDYMQTVPGVLDFTITAAGARLSGAANFAGFVGSYTSAAGHMVLMVAQSNFKYV